MEKENILSLIACVEYDINPELMFYYLERSSKKIMGHRPGPKKHTHEDEVKKYHEQGYNDKQIGEKIGLSRDSVWGYRNKMGLEPNRHTDKSERQEARMILYNQGYSDLEIARATGEEYSCIWRWRQRNNLPSNAKRSKEVKEKEIQKYYDKGYNDSEIASKTGYSTGQVAGFRKKYDLKSNYRRSEDNEKSF